MPDIRADNQANLERWLLEQWVLHLGRSVESMTGEVPTLEFSVESVTAPAEGVLWWRQPLNLVSEAVIWVGAGTETWSTVGSQVLEAAGIDESSEEDRRGSYLEILQQGLSALAQALMGMVRREVSCQSGSQMDAPPDAAVFRCDLTIKTRGLSIYIGFSPQLTAAILNAQKEEPAKPQPEPRSPSIDSLAIAEPGFQDAGLRRTLDLLYDVELPVSISFGRANLALKEVLKLTSGSIVELNRTVSEPVEVIVNNCVIARGEVVVVEGNYGVRILQIVSRNERLRTLH
jgi:flagellar motor switch protein FliN/FliY